VGDADGDGDLDIAVGNNGTQNVIYINSGPEMNLKQGMTAIADGGSYDFGSHQSGTDTDVIFTVENGGMVNLTLTTPLTIGGVDADQFSVQSQPSATVAASGNTTFTVRFSPTSTGVKTASISITNNDPDENPYNFTIQGTGTAAPSVTMDFSVGGGSLIHQFDFNGTLNDTIASGVSLTEHPNTASSGFGDGEWWWTADSSPGGGLILQTDQLTDPQAYSLGFSVKFNETGPGYKKIVSFKGSTDDNGLYFYGSHLNFFPFGSNTDITYSADEYYDFVFTRSDADVIIVYVIEGDGTITKVYEESDATDSSVPVLVGDDYQFMFFMDDGGSEWTTGGTVKNLRVWNQVLSATDIEFAMSAPATDITQTSATLNSALTSLGTASSVNVSFEYGLTTDYGTSTAAQAKTATGKFSAAISGLTQGTTYHFRSKPWETYCVQCRPDLYHFRPEMALQNGETAVADGGAITSAARTPARIPMLH
jgi:hypothetical protein